MKLKHLLTAAFLLAAASVHADTVTNNVDAVEIAADTNIVVAANEVLKIEYVHGDAPVTITKSGGGRLEIATSSISNLAVVVAEGTFASARPQALQLSDSFWPALRIDANDTSKFTISKSNGTNFISKITDADGNTDRWLTNWGGDLYKKPYVADAKLNGMGLIDFGSYRYANDTSRFANGYGGNFGVNNGGFPLKEYFYVWKDRDDMFDEPLVNGEEFRGPSVLGNNANYYLRGYGGGGKGFQVLSSGMYDTFKMNTVLDGQKVAYTHYVSRGFHVLRNRIHDSREPTLTMVGWNHPQGGGFLLAELIACSNVLSEATALRVEAQLESKWLGLKLKSVVVQEGATLDVGAFPFKIGTFDVQDGVTVAGITNLCFDTLTRASSNVVVSGTLKIDGGKQPLMPDLTFTGIAEIDIVGTSRVQTVSSTANSLIKTGAGELLLVEPVMSNITVTAGALSVSPLYARSAEYHLDSTRTDTIDWTETDGKKLISAWHDIEDPARAFKSTTWRKPKFDTSHLVRKPYLAESAVRGLTMVDFGTFANADHQDGWGACLDGDPQPSGLHDCFVAWIDDPDVKNYPLVNGAEFAGPCFFGMQYHWTRGKGGNGNSFAVHSTGSPINMWNPPEAGRVIVDGAVVHGTNYRLGDGVHVLAQRATTNDSKPGAPVEEIGGSYQPDIYGGLKIGEVLLFKEYLSDQMRMRVSGALCSKWRGDTNEWAYASLNVAAGATLNHPYADLVPDTLNLAGRISSVSVKPGTLQITGTDAEVEGELRLANGGSIELAYDGENGFAAMKASSVHASGRGDILFSVPTPSALAGQEFRVVESSSVTAAPDFAWRASSLKGSGVRADLKVKADGLYLVFDGCGMKFIFR